MTFKFFCRLPDGCGHLSTSDWALGSCNHSFWAISSLTAASLSAFTHGSLLCQILERSKYKLAGVSLFCHLWLPELPCTLGETKLYNSGHKLGLAFFPYRRVSLATLPGYWIWWLLKTHFKKSLWEITSPHLLKFNYYNFLPFFMRVINLVSNTASWLEWEAYCGKFSKKKI